MGHLPTGTVTFLFTEIEGSMRLAETLGDRYPGVLGEHCTIVREALRATGGTELNTQSDRL